MCDVLRRLLEERGLSIPEMERRTGIPVTNIRRMTINQEPKGSVLARIERAIDVPLGTVMMQAGLVQEDRNITMLLATDRSLHPVYQRQAVETYRLWKKLSAEERQRG